PTPRSSPWTGTNGAWGVGCAAGVAVVADSYWQAVTGRRALEIEWDEGDNGSLDSDAIRAQFTRLAEQPRAQARQHGDAPIALAGAAKRVEAVYEVPFLPPATFEAVDCQGH